MSGVTGAIQNVHLNFENPPQQQQHRARASKQSHLMYISSASKPSVSHARCTSAILVQPTFEKLQVTGLFEVKGHHARGQRNNCRGAAQRIVGFWLNPPWLRLIRESEGSRASPRSAEALGRKESARHQRCREAHRR
jgi:hypothetical protein